MDHFRNAVFSVCCVALGLSTADGILPSEMFRKQFRILTTLLLLTALAHNFTKIDLSLICPELQTYDSVTTEITDRASVLQATAMEKTIKESLNQELKEHNVCCTVQKVYLHNNENGGINIDRVTVNGNVLTGSVYLREWLGDKTTIEEEEQNVVQTVAGSSEEIQSLPNSRSSWCSGSIDDSVISYDW